MRLKKLKDWTYYDHEMLMVAVAIVIALVGMLINYL